MIAIYTVPVAPVAAPAIMVPSLLPAPFPMAALPFIPVVTTAPTIIDVIGMARIIIAIIPTIGSVAIIVEEAAIAIAVAGDIAGIFAIRVQITILVIAFVGIILVGIGIAGIAGAIAIIDGAGRQARRRNRQKCDVSDFRKTHNLSPSPAVSANSNDRPI